MRTFLKIINPSDWVKNCIMFSKTKTLNFVVLNFHDEEYELRVFSKRSFCFHKNETLKNKETIFSITVSQTIKKMFTMTDISFPKIIHVGVLVVTSDMENSEQVLGMVKNAINSFGLNVVSEIVATTQYWKDPILGRVGEVNANILTDFELHQFLSPVTLNTNPYDVESLQHFCETKQIILVDY